MFNDTDYGLFLNGLEASCRLLEENRERLNKLNYFPVADKDTGTNMALSMRKAMEYVLSCGCGHTPLELLEAYYDGLLEYGHGNSGTILTMFAEGFFEFIPAGKTVSGKDLAVAVSGAAAHAKDGVARVKDGTMLSVTADAARAGLSIAELTDDPAVIWHRICEEAHAALKMTAVRNSVLRQYGIVDSGALGMCLILDGLHSVLLPGEDIPPYDISETPVTSGAAPEELKYPYCTELLIEKNPSANAGELEKNCAPFGDCLLCVENAGKIKIHIHTDVPQRIKQFASQYGTLIAEKIEDMRSNVY